MEPRRGIGGRLVNDYDAIQATARQSAGHWLTLLFTLAYDKDPRAPLTRSSSRVQACS